MRVMITGAAGMLGRDLAEVLSCPPNHYELSLVDRAEFDIADSRAVDRVFQDARPQAVMHAAAYTDVDGCERDPAAAMRVNGEGARNVARAAAAAGARLLYVSTDYVFDGSGRRPYTEQDEPRPLGVYGRSKLAGEQAVLEHPDSLVVRTAWLYGRYGNHFVGAILDRARRGERLRVVNDQFGCPTWTKHLACAMAALLASGARGIVNAAGGGACSRYEFACAILNEARATGLLADFHVEPISGAELDSSAAPRPAYSVLSDGRLRELGIGPLPDWRIALREFLAGTN